MELWRTFSSPPNSWATRRLYISSSSNVQLSSPPLNTQLSSSIPTTTCETPSADPLLPSAMTGPRQRVPPSYLEVLNTRYDPIAKANAKPMEVSERAMNLDNTLREQARAEEGLVIEDFTELKRLVCVFLNVS